MPPTDVPHKEDEHLQEVNEELYKRNAELAVKNKTLSLLRELYQISILTLEPKPLGAKLASTIQLSFDFELVGIATLSPSTDTLTPLAAALSLRLRELGAHTPLDFVNAAITPVSTHPVLAGVVGERAARELSSLGELWGALIPPQTLSALTESGHIKSVLVYPLTIGEQTSGVLVLALNRLSTELNQFERESIGNFVNVIAVALDKALLYEQIHVANERLRELDRQKTEFVSIASHQLRTPLTAIKGYSSMLLESSYGELSGQLREPIQNIFDASQRLITIIEDFLNITRIELGKMQYEFTEVDLRALAERVVTELTQNAVRKGLALNFSTQVEGARVRADQGKITQALSNLIDNAIKYTPSGSVTVSLTPMEGDVVRITVSDTGVGMALETLTKLFDKFVRADDAGKLNYSGTGLGLYVAKQMVEAHQGRLWAESEGVGKGSSFIMELPALHTA